MSNGGVATFSIGRVLSRGFEVLRRNAASFGTLAAMFTLPPLLFGLFGGVETAYIEPHPGDRDGAATFSVGIVALVLLWVMLYFLVFAALTHGTICDLRGRPAGLGASLSWALTRLFPVIGISVIASVAAGLGLLLLVIPGLFLITVWWIAVPASVVERTGVFASLDRSFNLTRGYRWQVFGIIVIVQIGQFAAERLAVALLAWAPYFSAFAEIVITIAFTAYIAVVTAVCYHDLRIIKEGVGIDDIAKVFD